MQIQWSPMAEDDLIAIFDFIAEDNLQAAIKMDRLFRESAGEDEILTVPSEKFDFYTLYFF